MNLSIENELFGFQPYEFTNFLNGDSLIGGYKYKNQFICDLMEYKEEGHYYQYEDEDIIFYSPTEINEHGLFFFTIKKKFLLSENENFWFYVNFQINKEDLKIVMIEAVSKASQKSYYWTYSTGDYLVETTIKSTQDKYFDYYPYDIAFTINRFLVLKNITKSDIIDKIQFLKTEEEIITRFYK